MPLKTSAGLTVFCFQGVDKGCIGNKWIKLLDCIGCSDNSDSNQLLIKKDFSVLHEDSCGIVFHDSFSLADKNKVANQTN